MAKLGERVPLVERFWSKVDVRGADDCWPWTAYCYEGYGYIGLGGHSGRPERAHRVAYELTHGSIPNDLVIDHTCHNESGCPGGITCPHRRCCNPAHLEAVTRLENVQRHFAARVKTHCPAGHPYDEANSYVCGPRGTYRTCRACDANRQRARRAAARNQ